MEKTNTRLNFYNYDNHNKENHKNRGLATKNKSVSKSINKNLITNSIQKSKNTETEAKNTVAKLSSKESKNLNENNINEAYEDLMNVKNEYEDIYGKIEDKINLQIERLKLQNSNSRISQSDLNENSNQIKINGIKSNSKTQIKQLNTKHPITNKNIPSVVKFNNNYNENEFAIGKLNKSNCTPESIVKISKSNPTDDYVNQQGRGNASHAELFNQQLANMQKDIMVNNIKQNKLSLGTKVMMENERIHAQEATETGIYVTWCSKDKNLQEIECFRLGSNSKCICNHDFNDHEKIVTKKKFSSKCKNCKCKAFAYIPLYPEEIGEYWISHQPQFKGYKDYRVKCKCKHAWDAHSAERFLSCSLCSCSSFFSNFCCVVCNKFWNDHEVVYELEHERYMNKKAIQQDYMPLNECPQIRNLLYK